MRLPTMKISTRIFLAYVSLSVLLGAATLAGGYYSLGTLVEGIVQEDAKLVARELGVFLLPPGANSFTSMSPADRRALQEKIRVYRIRSGWVVDMQIIGEDGTILFASDRRRVGGRIVGREDLAQLKSGQVTMRTVHEATGRLLEITVPIETALHDRLGVLRMRIVPKSFTTYLDEPRTRFLWYFIIFVVLITLSGVVVASVFTVPVRRLNRALIELQTKHFRGATPPEVGDVAGALKAVNQMGERIEAMARGAARQEVALSSLSRALDEGVAIMDVSGRVVTANPAAAAILRCPAGAEAAVAVGAVLEADPGVTALVQQVLGAEQEVTGRDQEVALPDGRRVGVRLSVYLLRDPDRPAGLLLILRDLSSIRTFEQDLEEASRLSVLARLTASVAHEIKNPLNSMVINMEVLRGILRSLPEEVKAESERYVQVVTDEIYRLDEVIRDFLGLTNPGDVAVSQTDVNALVGRVADLIRYEAHTGARADRARTRPFAAPRARRPRAADAGLPEPLAERHPGDGGGRGPHDPLAAGGGHRRGRVRGRRTRHPGRDPGQDLQLPLHHPQGGNRPRPVDHPPDSRGPGWLHPVPEPARIRVGLHRGPPGCDGRAVGRLAGGRGRRRLTGRRRAIMDHQFNPDPDPDPGGRSWMPCMATPRQPSPPRPRAARSKN